MNSCGIFCTTCDCGRRNVACRYKKRPRLNKNHKWLAYGLVLAYAHVNHKDMKWKIAQNVQQPVFLPPVASRTFAGTATAKAALNLIRNKAMNTVIPMLIIGQSKPQTGMRRDSND